MALCFSALIAGCGGDGGEDPDEGGDSLPAPAQTIAGQEAAFERAVATLDCGDAIGVLHPAVMPEPEAGESKANCAATASLLEDFRGFEAGAGREYGTGALVDGELGGDEISLIWALDDEGSFKWLSSNTLNNEIGTEPAHDQDFAAPVDALLRALRDGDCNAAFDSIASGSRLSYGGDEKTFCANFDANFTKSEEQFGSRLREDPDAAAVGMGTTRGVAFYGVATDPAGYRTVVVDASAKGGEPKVFDVIPGPTGRG